MPIESIDPVYFDKTYYLAPDKGAAKPYSLLTEALKETKRCAVGRWAAKGKAYIVILRPIDNVLTMQQLHFAGEVRPATEVDVPKQEVKAPELKLARQLIEQQMAETFDPTAYTDDVKGRIEAAIQKKVEGQEISVSETPTEGRGQGHRPDGGAACQSREDRGGARLGFASSVRARLRSASSSRRKRPASRPGGDCCRGRRCIPIACGT